MVLENIQKIYNAKDDHSSKVAATHALELEDRPKAGSRVISVRAGGSCGQAGCLSISCEEGSRSPQGRDAVQDGHGPLGQTAASA